MNKTIQALREELNQLRSGNQQERKEADDEILSLGLENQALKGKINLPQMRLDM